MSRGSVAVKHEQVLRVTAVDSNGVTCTLAEVVLSVDYGPPTVERLPPTVRIVVRSAIATVEVSGNTNLSKREPV